MTDSTATRVLTVHNGSTSQRIKFYPGGTKADLEEGIRELFGFPEKAPLRFRDEDGDIVILSPAGIPSGSSLHVSVESGIPLPRIAPPLEEPETLDSELKPDEDEDHDEEMEEEEEAQASSSGSKKSINWKHWTAHDNGTLNGLVYRQDNSVESSAVYMHNLPVSGQHYFVIRFAKLFCCTAIGFIPPTLSSVRGSHNIGMYRLIALKAIGRGPEYAFESSTSEADGMDIGVYLDIDKNLVAFVNHRSPDSSTTISIDDIPFPATFVICSPKHDVSAELLPNESMPEEGVKITSSSKVTFRK